MVSNKYRLAVGAIVAVFATVLVVPLLWVGSAEASIWQGTDVHSDWSTPGDWLGGVPNGSSATAEFGDYGGAPYEANITVDDNYSVGSLIFSHQHSPPDYYLLCSAPNSLSLYDTVAVNGSGSSNIHCPLVLENNIGISGDGSGIFIYSPISGSGGITLDADPAFRIYTTEPATYTGPTYINSGKFQAGYDNTLSPYSDFVLADSADALLQLGGDIPVTIGSLSGGAASTVDLWGGTLTVGNDNNTTFAGTITNGIGGASSLVKQGSGTLTLSGHNTYTGTTTVAEGKLIIDGSLASSEVIVEADATLRGSGTLPAVTLYGIVAPGNSIGTLSGTDFTFASGSTLENEISPDGQTDLVDASSSITINPGSTLKIIPAAGTYSAGQTFTIARAPSISGTFSSVVETSGLLNYEVKYYSDRIDIVTTNASSVSAEPSSELAQTGTSQKNILLLGIMLISVPVAYLSRRFHKVS